MKPAPDEIRSDAAMDAQPLVEVVYSSETQLRRPEQLLRSMAHDLQAGPWSLGWDMETE